MIDYKKVLVKVKSGNRSGQANIQIPQSKGIYVSAQVITDDVNESNIGVGVYEQGNEILTTLPVSLFDGKMGTFEQRGVEINYKGGQAQAQVDLWEGDAPKDILVIVTFKIQRD